MHELSVALSLLDGISRTAEQAGIERVTAVHLRIGALSGIARDALAFSWDVASADTLAAGSELRIEDVPLAVYCERCKAERAPSPGTGLVCPVCRRTAPRILRGQELEIVAMEVPA
jgi:hydrogenase nickel incorporation protein HypA/HybF